MSLPILNRSRQIAGKEDAHKLNNTNGHTSGSETDGVRPNIVAEGDDTADLEQGRCVRVALEGAQYAWNVATAAYGDFLGFIRRHFLPVLKRIYTAAFKLEEEVEGWSNTLHNKELTDSTHSSLHMVPHVDGLLILRDIRLHRVCQLSAN